MQQLLRRIATLRAERVALVGTSLAGVLILAAFGAAAFRGQVRLSDVAAAVSFLLIIVVGLYASRLGAPGRSA